MLEALTNLYIRPLESTFQIWFQVRINPSIFEVSKYRIWIDIESKSLRFSKEIFEELKNEMQQEE